MVQGGCADGDQSLAGAGRRGLCLPQLQACDAVEFADFVAAILSPRYSHVALLGIAGSHGCGRQRERSGNGIAAAGR